ncbi:MFS transporter [Tichowtungia aerotolerans]|uniref:MFS transporter n=1 Tax=Tichowtungia aerotolerans TaxID=2697043 RepID=A0A6P1MCG0_9BACT|nr:MFS transporter [Tichowtungia aerotolerans]QHI70793.1 MFS transporter [Tichowtungia aerotolerans]
MSDKAEHHITKPEDRVARPRKLAYGSGMINYGLMVNSYFQMVNPIFNVVLGMNPAVIGLITAVSRLWDAITDPVMGKVSDNTRSRFGRRRPWILAGSLFTAIAFAAIWWFPREYSDAFYVGWLIVTTLFFYLGVTVFSVPYFALGMEMSPDYHERTRIVAYRDFLQPIGAFLAGALIWFCTRSVFDDKIEGMRIVSLGVAFIFVVLGIVASVFPREHPYAKQSAAQEKISLVQSAKQTLRVKPFLILCLSTAILLMGATMVGPMGYYICVYYMYSGVESEAAGLIMWGQAAYWLTNIMMVPVITWISTKIGKKNTVLAFIVVASVASLSKWWLITPANPWLSLIPLMFMGSGFIASSVMINSMLPDSVDADELETGTRREGMFSAVYGWSWKVGLSMALGVSGFLINLTGYDAELPEQTADAILKLRLFDLGVPVIGFITGFILLMKYPITEKDAYDVRARLEADRGNIDEEKNDV